ncbi:MAG: tyrosine-type recombinase/integrase [Halodesulfurarchaeum sp.]
MGERRRPDPAELSIREAVDRYLRRRRPDATDRSIEGWYYRLKLFVEWCESVGIETVGDLQRYDLDEYYEMRSSEVAPVTLEGEMWTLTMFMEFLENLGAVEEDLSEAVRIPDLDADERTSEIKLSTDAALALLRYYRSSSDQGTRKHVLLELLWSTGARQGGLRALDLRDAHLDDAYLDFRHRPETDTPLKNKLRGERPVAIGDAVVSSLRTYIRDHRYDVRDEHGRQPLLASTRGRPSPQTFRTWTYGATIPCEHTECPHGKERSTCEWVSYHEASKCPSSRSPHQIRTGAITWMLNRGWPPEDVAERVNASVEKIEQHYDKADIEERRRRLRNRMEDRRRPILDQLEIHAHSNDT